MRALYAVVLLSMALSMGCTPLERTSDYLASPTGTAQIERIVEASSTGNWPLAIAGGVTLLIGIAGAAVGVNEKRKSKAAKK